LGVSEPYRFTDQIKHTVEERVRDESTRIDHLAVGVSSKWLARAVLDGVCLDSVALELVSIKTLDISTVILVEARKFVVDEDWCFEVGWKVEMNPARALR
jgi:hypothetical protein